MSPGREQGADLLECPRCFSLMAEDEECQSKKCVAFREWALAQPQEDEDDYAETGSSPQKEAVTVNRIVPVLLTCLYLMGCADTPEQNALRRSRARAWCDTMGIRITGVSCDQYTSDCAVAPVDGAPFRLVCVACEKCDCALPVSGR